MDKFVVGGINIFKCRHCAKDDPKGFAHIPISLSDLARIRTYGRGAVEVKCLNGHTVSFVLKASNTMSMTVMPLRIEV